MKVVVFSYFLGTLELIHEALGDAVVGTITGAAPPSARQKIVDEFTACAGHAVLLGQIEAAKRLPHSIGIAAQIESAAGFLYVREIAAASPRRQFLMFGAGV